MGKSLRSSLNNGQPLSDLLIFLLTYRQIDIYLFFGWYLPAQVTIFLFFRKFSFNRLSESTDPIGIGKNLIDEKDSIGKCLSRAFKNLQEKKQNQKKSLWIAYVIGFGHPSHQFYASHLRFRNFPGFDLFFDIDLSGTCLNIQQKHTCRHPQIF